MSVKNVAKIFGLVGFLAVVNGMLSGCSKTSRSEIPLAETSGYQKPEKVGRFENRDIKESSGVAASPCQSGVFWTHNDSGDGPYIFAFDLNGKNLGKWTVDGAQNTDWEDIAATKDETGACQIYIGEIGDNNLQRSESAIYRVPEPAVSGVPAGGEPERTEPAAALRFRYPDGPHNAETLLENPRTKMLYVLTKLVDGPAGIYRLRPEFGSQQIQVAEKIGEIAVPSIPNGLLTAGSISPDGQRVFLSDYTSGYELVLPAGSASFDDIWRQKPVVVDLGGRKQGEGVTYTADGRSIVTTSEGKGAVISRVDRGR